MKKKFSPQFVIITLLILIAAFSRLLTNQISLWNFTPITAIALFSGAVIYDKKLAFIIPLIALLITDAFLGFYEGIWLVYGAFAIITCVGFLLQNRIKIVPVVLASLAASTIFYLLTNFALFYPTHLYPHTSQGIMTSYTAGLPFYRTAIAGDLFYSGVLFLGYELILKKFFAPAKAV